MKRTAAKGIEQPKPFSPGVTSLMVREHAMNLHRDKLLRGALGLEDWVLAEKDLVAGLQQEEIGPVRTRW